MLGYHKGSSGWEIPEKQETIILKRLVKQRKEEFKTQENIEWKWEAGNICQKRKDSSQNWRVGISVFFARLAVGVTLLYNLCQHVPLTGTVITCITTKYDLEIKFKSRYRLSLILDADVIAKLFIVIGIIRRKKCLLKSVI